MGCWLGGPRLTLRLAQAAWDGCELSYQLAHGLGEGAAAGGLGNRIPGRVAPLGCREDPGPR